MNVEDTERVRLYIYNIKNEIPLNNINDIIARYRQFPQYMKLLLDQFERENKVYTYMLTFTINPKIWNVKSTDLHDILEEYIIDFAERRKPINADLVKEGTDEDHKHTHWHLGIETKKYVDFSNFLKYYRKKYGSVDISKSWSNDYKNILKYINKSESSQKIV